MKQNIRSILLNIIIIILFSIPAVFVFFIYYNKQDIIVWLGFLGSIFGGLLTMLGVLLSLAHNERMIKNDYLKKIIPFIKASKNDLIFTEGTFQPVIIKNVSDYPLLNLNIDSIGCEFRGQNIFISKETIKTINFLPSGEEFILVFTEFPINMETIGESEYLEINITMTFYDFMSEICYSHYFDFSVIRSKNKNKLTNKGKLILDNVINTYNHENSEYEKNLTLEVKKAFKRKSLCFKKH